MKLSSELQKIYDLKRAEKTLEKYKILDSKQKDSISAECAKAVKK